jgi:hypothetical protein
MKSVEYEEDGKKIFSFYQHHHNNNFLPIYLSILMMLNVALNGRQQAAILTKRTHKKRRK